MRYKTFGERFCTYCGGSVVYFIDEDGLPAGVCKCGNVDYCDDETVEETKKRYGASMHPPKRDTIIM